MEIKGFELFISFDGERKRVPTIKVHSLLSFPNEKEKEFSLEEVTKTGFKVIIKELVPDEDLGLKIKYRKENKEETKVIPLQICPGCGVYRFDWVTLQYATIQMPPQKMVLTPGQAPPQARIMNGAPLLACATCGTVIVGKALLHSILNQPITNPFPNIPKNKIN